MTYGDRSYLSVRLRLLVRSNKDICSTYLVISPGISQWTEGLTPKGGRQ